MEREGIAALTERINLAALRGYYEAVADRAAIKTASSAADLYRSGSSESYL